MYMFNGQYFPFVTDKDERLRDFYREVTIGGEPIEIEPLPRVQGGAQAQVGVCRHVGHLFDSNMKIEAIKLVRLLSGWGLKESKDWAEEIAELFRGGRYIEYRSF